MDETNPSQPENKGGGGDRELISKEHALSDMRTLRHAIRQHWQIPADLYARLAARLTEIVETSTVPREIVAAAKVLTAMHKDNVDSAVQVDKMDRLEDGKATERYELKPVVFERRD
jgi:hypothetical protein